MNLIDQVWNSLAAQRIEAYHLLTYIRGYEGRTLANLEDLKQNLGWKYAVLEIWDLKVPDDTEPPWNQSNAAYFFLNRSMSICTGSHQG